MPLHFERVQWMPSPPLVPDDGAFDFDHLKRMTMGDASLEREVLAMFAAQASELIEKIVKMPPNVDQLAHKLRGSAEAVGAFRIIDAAEWLSSQAVLSQRKRAGPLLPDDGFAAERWRCAERLVIGQPYPIPRQREHHGQNQLCRSFRRNPQH
jgi:HPt (histidine-containing phosphotransfer) domain-containing protein